MKNIPHIALNPKYRHNKLKSFSYHSLFSGIFTIFVFYCVAGVRYTLLSVSALFL